MSLVERGAGCLACFGAHCPHIIAMFVEIDCSETKACGLRSPKERAHHGQT